MANERENLLSKIEDGEGANTALKQLKDENVRHLAFKKPFATLIKIFR